MTRYIIQDKSNSSYDSPYQFIDVDNNSGGYPYVTAIDRCKKWRTYASCKAYLDKFPNENWEIKVLTYNIESLTVNDIT